MGFDIRGDIKIFDFGLAKELRILEPNEYGTYKLTGMSTWRDWERKSEDFYHTISNELTVIIYL